MEYDIVEESYIFDLVDAVNDKLKDGWQLQGGICKTDFSFYQAIVKVA